MSKGRNRHLPAIIVFLVRVHGRNRICPSRNEIGSGRVQPGDGIAECAASGSCIGRYPITVGGSGWYSTVVYPVPCGH
jgi:hypothetical protein